MQELKINYKKHMMKMELLNTYNKWYIKFIFKGITNNRMLYSYSKLQGFTFVKILL